MKIRELDRHSRHWSAIAAFVIISLVVGIFGIKYYYVDRPQVSERRENSQALNRGLEVVRGMTFEQKEKQIDQYITWSKDYAIGAKENYPLLEIGNVSGDYWSDAHYYRLNTNNDQVLRIVRRIETDQILFCRWIDQSELHLWERMDQYQEKLAANPQQMSLNSDIIKLKKNNPQLSN